MANVTEREKYMDEFRDNDTDDSDEGYEGTIERISISDDEGDKGPKARVSIRHGSKPKPSKNPSVGGSYPPTSDVCISPEEAEDLHVGQKVRIRIEAV